MKYSHSDIISTNTSNNYCGWFQNPKPVGIQTIVIVIVPVFHGSPAQGPRGPGAQGAQCSRPGAVVCLLAGASRMTPVVFLGSLGDGAIFLKHIPYEQWVATWSHLEFTNHLIAGEFLDFYGSVGLFVLN